MGTNDAQFKVETGERAGRPNHALVKLTNKKRVHERYRRSFFRSLANKGPVWIAQQIAEECDARLDFDEQRVLKLFSEASPEDRLKVAELLKARASYRHENYLEATKFEVQDEDRTLWPEFERLLAETEATRRERDAGFSPHYEVYYYTALAPFFNWDNPGTFVDYSHAALAVVEKDSREGILLSWKGLVDSRAITLKTPDPFAVAYARHSRPVCRYRLSLPQDEAHKVYDAARALIAEWAQASTEELLIVAKFLARMCGDNAADALESSWSYMFQAYRDHLDDGDPFGNSPSYFSPRILDIVNMTPGTPYERLLDAVGRYVDTPEGGVEIPALSTDVPRFAQHKYHLYYKVTGGNGIVTERVESDP